MSLSNETEQGCFMLKLTCTLSRTHALSITMDSVACLRRCLSNASPPSRRSATCLENLIPQLRTMGEIVIIPNDDWVADVISKFRIFVERESLSGGPS